MGTVTQSAVNEVENPEFGEQGTDSHITRTMPQSKHPYTAKAQSRTRFDDDFENFGSDSSEHD